MSDDFHRPTYTAPAGEPHRVYNTTQVRLYGVQGININSVHGQVPNVAADGVIAGRIGDHILTAVLDTGEAGFEQLDAQIRKLGAEAGAFQDVHASFVFLETVMRNYMFMLTAVRTSERGIDRGSLSSGVIFGYAYEGHCYDFPKPKIMLIPALPEVIPADDCAFDRKSAHDYRVWIVDKLDHCVEIEINQGFVEQIVLEANLPGKRSPTMYAGRMMLGHRGGRLTE
jgi:hypothetical protein